MKPLWSNYKTTPHQDNKDWENNILFARGTAISLGIKVEGDLDLKVIFTDYLYYIILAREVAIDVYIFTIYMFI